MNVGTKGEKCPDKLSQILIRTMWERIISAIGISYYIPYAFISFYFDF